MKILKKLQWGIYSWIWFVLVIWITWLAYAALDWIKVNTWDSLTATKWNSLVDHAVPSTAIMAFNSATCPTWWSPANWTNWNPDLRWEFIRWLDNWRWIDIGRTLNDHHRAYEPVVNSKPLDWYW